MLVWSLSVTVSYADGSWSGSEYTYHRGELLTSGPDVSSLPQVKALWSALGMNPSGDAPFRTDIVKVVLRFMSIYTDSFIRVLGTTENLEITSNNSESVIQALRANAEFSDQFLSSSYALLVSVEQLSGFNTYPQSAAADDTGIYVISRLNAEFNNIIIKKIVGSQVVWMKALSTTQSDLSPNRIRISPVDKHLYVLCTRGMLKLSPTDGSIVWSYFNEDIGHNFVSIGFKSNGDIVTVGSLDSNEFLLATWSAVNADKLSENTVEVSGNISQYINADIIVDADDNVIMPLAYNDNGYGTVVVKYDITNSAIIWHFNITDESFGDDQDCTACGVDSLGNIYINGYGQGLTKLSPSGQLQWAIQFNQYMPGMGVLSDGTCMLYGDPGNDLRVAKIGSDGAFNWATRISANDDLDNAGWANEGNSMAQVVNDQVYLVAGYDVNGEQELLLSIGRDQIIGNYTAMQGAYELSLTFADDTQNITVSSANPANEPTEVTTTVSDLLIRNEITTTLVEVSQTVVKIELG